MNQLQENKKFEKPKEITKCEKLKEIIKCEKLKEITKCEKLERSKETKCEKQKPRSISTSKVSNDSLAGLVDDSTN